MTLYLVDFRIQVDTITNTPARRASMKKSKEEIIQLVETALEQNKVISLVTYYLSNYGEDVLNTITETTNRILFGIPRPPQSFTRILRKKSTPN